ncbi:MAG: shikimate dehydrogenase [Spirochaetaceae bacterium]|nr:MAG: shikimate dehydrogenase [Spirochaetaceae bacterium]
MEQSYLDNLVGVFGHPVAENPTCVMQDAAFAHLGIRWKYLTIEVLPRDLAAAVAGMRAMNMRGINLTIPHKVAVIDHLDEVAPDAAVMGAVNTVRRDGDRLIGENTDGKGFLRSLSDDAGIDPCGKRVMVLGAGGASRAICVELANAGAARIDLVNRSVERAEALVDLLQRNTGSEVRFRRWDATVAVDADVDVLVNATSIGLFPDVGALPDVDMQTVREGMVVCDVIPNPPQTAFLDLARDRGAITLDGLGMLVYQGAIGFKMWTGLEAPVDVMRGALQKVFG